jgi:hypothetical protein
MQMNPIRRSPWARRIAALYLWIHRVADRKWAAAETRIGQLKAAHPAPSPRPMSPTVSPAAKEIEANIVAAIKEASRRTARRIDAWTLVTYEKSGEMADVILGDAQEFLDLLHQGARKSAVSPPDFPPSWQGDWAVVRCSPS